MLLSWSQLHAAILEIPNHDAVVSGIGVISGWKCEVEGELSIVFEDGNPISLLYGSERKDTEKVCGDEKNGFVSIWNWGNLSEGTHTAVVYDKGVEFDRATFDIVTYQTDFLRGASGQCDVQGFPSRGEIATLVWNQSTQHFELGEIRTEIEEPIEEPEKEEEGQQDRVAELHQEVENNNVPAVRALLAAGADPNMINPDRGIHRTALHLAVSHNGSLSIDMVELLLQYGADPNIPSSEFTGQDTALHSVFDSWLRHWQEDVLLVLGLLLDAGANVQALTNAGGTPLHRAVSVTGQLTRGSDWRLPQDVWEHVRTVFQTLLDAGADINAQGPIPQGPDVEWGFMFNEYGRTVLHYALSGQHTFLGGSEIVEFLLDSGADPNLRLHSVRGRSVRDGLTETFVEELLPDKTAFLYAMSGANVHPNRIPLRIVQLFLDAGADPNILNADGLTALFYMYNAKKDEQEEIERALIVAGADPTLIRTREDGEVISYTCLTEECQAVQDAR